MKIKTVDWHIYLPIDLPEDWDDEVIEFHLNDSSWCCDNLIYLLEKYSKENGCICDICEAKVLKD